MSAHEFMSTQVYNIIELKYLCKTRQGSNLQLPYAFSVHLIYEILVFLMPLHTEPEL